MRPKHVLVPLALLTVTSVLLLSGVTSSVGAADGEYEISVAGSIDTPTREVNLEGATYNVSAIGKAETNSSIDVTVTAPDSNQLYRVYLYNSDKQIVKGNTGTGDETLTFELDGLDPGTYIFAVQEQGANKKIHPLVIKGYETTLEMPTSATIGETVTVDISTEQIHQNATRDRVEIVVAGQETQINKTASETGGSYTTTIDTDPFTAGTYRVYANVRGGKAVYGQKEIYGVSDSHSLSVRSQDKTAAATENTDEGATATDSQPESTEVTTTSGPTGKIKITSEPSPEPTTSTESTTTASSSTDTPPADTSVITPSSETAAETPTTIPGFSVLQVIGGVLLIGLIIRRRA